jgi:transposase
MAALEGDAREPGGEVLAPAVGLEALPEAYRRRRRRSWTPEEKLAIVQEAEASDDSVAEVARRHGMNANHLFNWIQRHRDRTLDRRTARPALDPAPMTFLDLGLVGEAGAGIGAGVIEIEFPSRVRVRVGAQVESEALHRVLTVLKAVA